MSLKQIIAIWVQERRSLDVEIKLFFPSTSKFREKNEWLLLCCLPLSKFTEGTHNCALSSHDVPRYNQETLPDQQTVKYSKNSWYKYLNRVTLILSCPLLPKRIYYTCTEPRQAVLEPVLWCSTKLRKEIGFRHINLSTTDDFSTPN